MTTKRMKVAALVALGVATAICGAAVAALLYVFTWACYYAGIPM